MLEYICATFVLYLIYKTLTSYPRDEEAVEMTSVDNHLKALDLDYYKCGRPIGGTSESSEIRFDVT